MMLLLIGIAGQEWRSGQHVFVRLTTWSVVAYRLLWSSMSFERSREIVSVS